MLLKLRSPSFSLAFSIETRTLQSHHSPEIGLGAGAYSPPFWKHSFKPQFAEDLLVGSICRKTLSIDFCRRRSFGAGGGRSMTSGWPSLTRTSRRAPPKRHIIRPFIAKVPTYLLDQQHRESVIETANLPAVSPSLLPPFSILIAPQEELSGNPFVSQTSRERPRTMIKILKANLISSYVTFFPFSFSESQLYTSAITRIHASNVTCINVFLLIFFFFPVTPPNPLYFRKLDYALTFDNKSLSHTMNKQSKKHQNRRATGILVKNICVRLEGKAKLGPFHGTLWT